MEAPIVLSAEELDTLPFGAIRLDAEGRVSAYNLAESRLAQRSRESVLGRHFFDEIAPCADTAEFKGVLDQLTARGQGTAHFDYRFRFPWGDATVRVRLMVFGKHDRWIFVTRRLTGDEAPEA